MPPTLVRYLMAAVAVVVLAGFLVLYGNAIAQVWSAGNAKANFPAEYVYVATALAGLVGGVAAMIFNEKLPDDVTAKPAAGRSAGPPATPSATGLAAGVQALNRALVPQNGGNRLFSVVASGYVIGYFLAGLAAIVTWVVVSDRTPDLVKNLALIAIGLFVAIARSFFHVPKP